MLINTLLQHHLITFTNITGALCSFPHLLGTFMSLYRLLTFIPRTVRNLRSRRTEPVHTWSSGHDPNIPPSVGIWEHAANNCTAPNSLPFSLHTQSSSNHSISQGLSVKSNPNALLEIVVCLVEKKKHVKPVLKLHEKSENKSFCSTVHWGGDVAKHVFFPHLFLLLCVCFISHRVMSCDITMRKLCWIFINLRSKRKDCS